MYTVQCTRRQVGAVNLRPIKQDRTQHNKGKDGHNVPIMASQNTIFSKLHILYTPEQNT